ncbi:MAG: DUF2142 domain-containing protein [Anaerolineales bacterium]|nr:DUF2142 domain-containing protein [Anaerolineales bacterium]
MAAILIPLIFLLITQLIHLTMQPSRDLWDWRDSVAFGYLSVSAFFFLTCEGLSLLKLLTRDMIVLVWGAILLILLLVLRKMLSNRPIAGTKTTPEIKPRPRKFLDWLFLCVLTVIIILTGITAYIAPPHESDVLAYHMPRVLHWIQNQTTANYAVPDARHLWMPPWPAYAQTNLYLLSGGDKLANMIQWSAMLLSVILASRLAAYLGATRRGQLLAALFVATLPVGIYQASSSFTDYSAASWVTVSALLVLRSRKTDIGWVEWIGLGLSVALGYLTKGTYILFALPILAYLYLTVSGRPDHLTGWYVAS